LQMVHTSVRINVHSTVRFPHESTSGPDHSCFSSLRQGFIVRLSPWRVKLHSDHQSVPNCSKDLSEEEGRRTPFAEADTPWRKERLHPHPSTLDSFEAGKVRDTRS
jgi:hypothetical protein